MSRIKEVILGLRRSASTLDLDNKTARGHLVSGRLGTIPIEIRQKNNNCK